MITKALFEPLLKIYLTKQIVSKYSCYYNKKTKQLCIFTGTIDLWNCAKTTCNWLEVNSKPLKRLCLCIAYCILVIFLTFLSIIYLFLLSKLIIHAIINLLIFLSFV